MLDILSVTGVVFLLITAGFAAVRSAVFSAPEMGVLGRYVIRFGLPALIFRAVSTRNLAEIVEPGFLLAYGAGSLAVLGAGYALARRAMGQTPLAATFGAMGMSCANSGFVGYPVLLMAMPDVAGRSLALAMIVENLVLLPLVLAMAEGAGAGGAKGRALFGRIGGRLARNPILIALVAGLAVSASGLTLPPILDRPIGLIADSSAAVALFVIGGTLAGLPLHTVGGDILPVILGKLVLHPLAVWVALGAVGAMGLGVGDPMLAQSAVVLAAMPAMAIYPILAQQYGHGGPAAQAMGAMTVLSFLSISAVLFLLGLGAG